MGITRACGLVGISRSLFAYESERTGDVALTERMKEMAALKRRYGYRRILFCCPVKAGRRITGGSGGFTAKPA